jgi:hypothetical protein
MPAYPSTPAWAYPLVRSLEFRTQIAIGQNGTEQRWALTPGEERWTISYPRLRLADRDVLLAFFDAAKGAYAGDIVFTFAGTPYVVHFEEDRLRAVEAKQGRWNVTVSLRTVTRAADVGALPADFPVLSTGARVQLPYTHEHGFETISVRTEGARYSYAHRTAAARTWSAGGTVLTDAEAAAIWDMFRLARGRWASFAFTDPDSAVRYATCRFASDTLEWRYNAKNNNSVEVQIQQIP